MSQSEVQRLLAQIDAEYQSAQWGLLGLAQGIAQHDFINARLENMENTRQDLEKLVGAEKAAKLVVKRMNKQADKEQRMTSILKKNRLLTVQEVAGELGVDAGTVRRWVREGLMEGILLPGNVRHRHRIREETLQSISRGLPKSTGDN